MANTLALGASAARLRGSSPLFRTNLFGRVVTGSHDRPSVERVRQLHRSKGRPLKSVRLLKDAPVCGRPEEDSSQPD